MAKRKIITVDCETDPFKHGRIPEPFIWGAYDGKDFWDFTDTDEFCDWLADQYAYVYAHNGGKFDFHFILDRLDVGEKIKIINGRLADAKLGKARLRDSINLLPFSLAAMNKEDIEYWKMETGCREIYWDEIREYLYWDCRHLHHYLTEFRKRFGLSTGRR